MSINSIDSKDIVTNWERDQSDSLIKNGEQQLKSAEVRRRIEMMREIKESGLTLEEARELGLLY